MKKTFICLFFNISLIISAQEVYNEDFNSYTPGNIGTDVNFTNPGQGGFYTRFGSNSDFQVATSGVTSNHFLKITNGANYDGFDTYDRLLRKDISGTALPGNYLLNYKIDFYTGSADGKGDANISLYDYNKVIIGIAFNIQSRLFYGFIGTTMGGTSYQYASSVGGQNPYPANTWVTINMTYDRTTGRGFWTFPNGNVYTITKGSLQSGYDFQTGLQADRIYMRGSVNYGNTAAFNWGVDNMTLKYEPLGALSTIEENSIIDFDVYPNPVSDYVYLKSKSKINNVELLDWTGRKQNVRLEHNKIDLRHVPSGIYLIKIMDGNIIHSKKINKK